MKHPISQSQLLEMTSLSPLSLRHPPSPPEVLWTLGGLSWPRWPLWWTGVLPPPHLPREDEKVWPLNRQQSRFRLVQTTSLWDGRFHSDKERVITNLCESPGERETGGTGAVDRAGVKGGRCGSGFASLSVYRVVWQGSSCERVRSTATRGPTFEQELPGPKRQTASEVYFMLEYKPGASLCEGEHFHSLVFPLSTAALFCVWQVQAERQSSPLGSSYTKLRFWYPGDVGVKIKPSERSSTEADTIRNAVFVFWLWG